jgi:hypothetical protein
VAGLFKEAGGFAGILARREGRQERLWPACVFTPKGEVGGDFVAQDNMIFIYIGSRIFEIYDWGFVLY